VKDDVKQKLYELSEQKDIAWIELQIDEEPTFKLIDSGRRSDGKDEFDEMRKKTSCKGASVFPLPNCRPEQVGCGLLGS